MKFSTATALAALVAVVSSAAIQRRGSPLPEHFGLAIVSDSPAIDGLRVRYTGKEYFTYVPSRPEAVFRGGADRVTLDPTVHPLDFTSFDKGGERELSVFLKGVSQLVVYSKEMQDYFTTNDLSFIVSYVELDGMLRPVDKDGAMLDLRWTACGNVEIDPDYGQNDVMVVWNDMFESDCPRLGFKIIEL